MHTRKWSPFPALWKCFPWANSKHGCLRTATPTVCDSRLTRGGMGSCRVPIFLAQTAKQMLSAANLNRKTLSSGSWSNTVSDSLEKAVGVVAGAEGFVPPMQFDTMKRHETFSQPLN